MTNIDPELCDRCCATAAVHVLLPRTGGVLFFCNHHLAEFGDQLLAQGWVMAPDDASLTTSDSASAFADVVSTFDAE